MVSPELTEAVLAAVAPDVLNKAREVQQETSAGPVPPDVQNILQGGQPVAPSEGAPVASEVPVVSPEDIQPAPDVPADAGEPPSMDAFGFSANGLTAAAGECPPATQDVVINLDNRKKAIDGAMYGPLNPAEPNTKYWKEIAGEWRVTVAEAKKQRCGNCAVFIQTPEMMACIEGGLTDNADEFDAIDAAGELGYCEAFDFKCASARTCRAWIAGGPVTEEGGE
jgi:hypothetical protein